MTLPDFYIDVTEAVPSKSKALEEFASQGYTREFNQLRLQEIERHYGFEIGVTYAEPFYSSRSIVLSEFPLSRGVPDYGRKVEGVIESE